MSCEYKLMYHISTYDIFAMIYQYLNNLLHNIVIRIQLRNNSINPISSYNSIISA